MSWSAEVWGDLTLGRLVIQEPFGLTALLACAFRGDLSKGHREKSAMCKKSASARCARWELENGQKI